MPQSTTRRRRMLSDSDKYRKTRSSRDEPLSRSEKVPVVVGEGTYGCVVNPSLQCEDGHHPDTYDHTVTKIMDSGDAADEYEELSKIASIDGIERYVLKLPHKCVPDLSRRFDKTVRKCKGKRIMRNFKTPDKYKLLIMEDGGADLYNVLRTVLPKMNFADICRFLTAIRELIEALVFFRNNMIIHHDIKQENIVYNVNTGSMKFIDFGLMMWRNEFISRAEKDSNSQGISWFNFPTESKCINKTTYDTDKSCEKYRNMMSYKEFVKKSADTFDVFSLSLVIYNITKIVRGIPEFKRHVDAETFYEDMKVVVGPFYDGDMRARPTHIQQLHKNYDALLRKYKLVNETKPTPTTKTVSAYKSATKSFVKDKSKSITRKSSTRKNNIDSIPRLGTNSSTGGKRCPQNKIMNPTTNRCVKRCDPNQIRDGNFRCITLKNTTECSDGKERNPTTRRCVKRCGQNQTRDTRFRCITRKQRKN